MGKIAQMMGGLPMNELIGAPLTSVVDAQRDLAKTMIGYVNEIGYADGEGKGKEARMLDFKLTKPVISEFFAQRAVDRLVGIVFLAEQVCSVNLYIAKH